MNKTNPIEAIVFGNNYPIGLKKWFLGLFPFEKGELPFKKWVLLDKGYNIEETESEGFWKYIYGSEDLFLHRKKL